MANMSPQFVKKPPMIFAIGSATVRINAPDCEKCPLHIQVMKPSEHDHDGKLMEPGSFYSLWMHKQDVKLFADALYAQGALDLIE